MSLDFDSARLPNPHLRPEHEAWRTQLRRFIDTEIMPHAESWIQGHIKGLLRVDFLTDTIN